ncbi:M48 family metallopeptidase [Nocardioides marmorisolisilvae]|uniref:M48 family peptidase n=1 Tax=Nocardioides marmorisolisilvae TaxID=1542737 RepID=A0A3N0DTX9_9ACTN|nr:M48 family metallopeptidase [Nocardioides marmorisolisilvae]RNL79078.1 M48 family peptidase [Nocardioides marmorisolisilvae]
MSDQARAEESARASTRVSLVVVVVAGLLFAVLAGILIPWHWLPGQHVRAVPARSVFTAAQIDRAEHVSAMFRYSGWANLAIGTGVALLLGLTRLGSSMIARLPGRWWLQVLLGTVLLVVVSLVVQLPLAAFGHHADRRYDLSGQSWGPWLYDQVISAVVTAVFTGIGLLVLLAIVRRAPRSWPVWAAGAGAALTMLGSFVYPVVVEPLFNNFSSMPAGPLRTDIFRLAAAEHVHIDDVLVADASKRTTTLNAYVSGFGSTRRVVVYDTVLKDLSNPEIESIVAHELGHAKHQDVLVGTVLGALGGAFGIGLLGLLLADQRLLRRSGARDAADPRVLPLLFALIAVGTFLASPIENTMSRAVEARADRTALTVTHDPVTFEEMQKQLSLRSLADPTPPRISQFWFGSHPTVLQRIGMARLFAENQDEPR